MPIRSATRFSAAVAWLAPAIDKTADRNRLKVLSMLRPVAKEAHVTSGQITPQAIQFESDIERVISNYI